MTLNWIPAVLTMIASLMIAANLGARVTGAGFVGVALASALWITLQSTGNEPDSSIIAMHSILLLVNLFGVWRWLGKKRHYEDGRTHAHERSRRAPVPTLFSADAVIGATVRANGEETRGKIVDVMLTCDKMCLAYVVTSESGVNGAGETLRVVPPRHLRFANDEVVCDLSEAQWRGLPTIEDDQWPEAAPPAPG
jgi:hypothetical protein